MAFPEHWAYQFGGTLLNGADIWTNTVRFANPTGGGGGVVNEDDLAQQMTDDLAVRFAATVTGGGLGYSSQTRLEWGKFNKIGPTGAYADPTTTHMYELTTPIAGPGAPPSNAPQLALAITWTTPVARGYANKGRIFVPMPAISVGATGKMSTTDCLNAAKHWGYMINEWGDLSGLDLSDIVPCVVSNVQANGAVNEITGVKVGDVMDTMRSRRNALVETYQTAPVTAAP